MTYVPVIPASGLLGWQFLNRTLENQQEAYENSVAVKRDADYFRENIASIRTAEALVADRRLLGVALSAFGLSEDIDAKAFIQKVLEEGTLKDDAFANRLADKRYVAFSRAFGFGDLGPRTNVTTFPDEILSRHLDNSFEEAVGQQDPNLRLALNFGAELSDLVAETEAETSRWFLLMGNPPLRTVMEGALGLPSGFGQLDIDKQLEGFRDRALATFGTSDLAELAEPEMQERIVRLFLIRSEINATQSFSSASVALTLLGNLA